MWTLTFIAVVICLWLIYRKQCFSELKKMGVPGPEPNLIFGNMLELAIKSPIKCHEKWFKKYGNIIGYYAGTRPVVSVADVELLKKIQVSEFHKFINRPNLFIDPPDRTNITSSRVEGFRQQLIVLRDKRWKEIRSIITPSFTASKMKQMVPIINGAIDSLVENVDKKCSSGEDFNIYLMYKALTMDVIGRTVFGIQTDAQNNPDDPLLRSSNVLNKGDITSALAVLALSFRYLSILWTWMMELKLIFMNRGTNPLRGLIQSVKDVISMRRNNKQSRKPDLLQVMIDAEIDDLSAVTYEDLIATVDTEIKEKEKKAATSSKLISKMTDADILDNSVLFFLAGYEPTSIALGFTTHFLIQHPEAQDKVRQEVQQLLDEEGEFDYYSVSKLQYLDQVFQESLRLYPPIFLFVSRECGEDIEFGKIKLKKGTAVQVPAFYLQRDPDLWGPDANEFNPERFSPENKSKIHPMAFQAFGQGPRNCVGMRFAYMEAKLALARLLSKYKFTPCFKTESEPITLKISTATINPKNGIWTKVEPV